MQINKVGFIGLGLIGGSIAKAIKLYYPTTEILGLASRQATIDLAFNEGTIINNENASIEDFKDCDIIFLCCPVGINIEYLQQLKHVISSDCLITDVGSVKGDITLAIKEMGLGNQFIGGHPMTGSENTGFENASEGLLENAYYILTTEDDFDKSTLLEFKQFINSIGAVAITITPEEHDYATAAISHLPHVVAASLVNLVADEDKHDICKTIAAGGFKDITRIASSSPVMWQHICMSNKDEILKLIELYKSQIEAFEKEISEANADNIKDLFQKAKNYRDSLTIKSTKYLGCEIYELYCYVEDKAGTIAATLNLLSDKDISIKNIDVVHNREFEPGVLRLEFYNAATLDHAFNVLKDNNYDVKVRKD